MGDTLFNLLQTAKQNFKTYEHVFDVIYNLDALF